MAWEKLQKLCDKSADEWRTRGAQEWAKWQERWLGKGCTALSDAALHQAFTPSAQGDSLQTALTALLTRLQQPQRVRFMPAFTQRAAVIGQMKDRFPAEAQKLIQQADHICAGRFTIFEHGEFEFGISVDWHREPQSGIRTPLVHWSKIDYLNPNVAGDKKFTWELNRHQFLITLGQAYWLTGDEKYAVRFVALVDAWITANPPKQGINWASSLECAFRVIAWLWALHFFADAKSVTLEFIGRLLKSLIQQTQHVETYLSHYFSPNTHLTGEALALFYVGTALPELNQAEHWRQTGRRILLEQLPRHVGRDGVYFEQASYYHRYTTDFYTHFVLLSRASGEALPELVNEKLTGLHEHLMWITRPDGGATFYGDDDGGRLVMLSARRADDFRDTLATGAALGGRADWKFVAGASHETSELLWLLGANGWQTYDALAAQPPQAGLKAFVESGYYVMRDSWERDASYVWLDCGKHGAMNCGHAHADALSFEFAIGGVTWFVDPATFTYTGDLSLRNEIRSSFSHNTVSVDGETQSVPQNPFTWRHIAQSLIRECRESSAEMFFAGQQNGYVRLSDPVRQQRFFTLQKKKLSHPGYLVIRDAMEAQATHRYALHFHCAPGCEIIVDNQHQARVLQTDGLVLRVVWQMREGQPPDEVQWEVSNAWVSRCYGQRQAAPVLTIRFTAAGNITWETMLVPVTAGTQAETEKTITQFRNA